MRIAGWALGLSMAVAGIGVAVGASQGVAIETRAAAATMTPGTNGSVCGVNSNSNNGVKVGTSSKGGDMSITVGAGATTLHLYAAAWKGVTGLSLNISGATANPSSIALTADEGVSNGTPFTLSGDEDDFKFDIALSNITTDTTITFTTSIAKRCVVWNATYDVAPSDPTITLGSSTLSLNGTESKNVSVSFASLTNNITVSQSSENGGEVTLGSASISKDASSPVSFSIAGKTPGTVNVSFASPGATTRTLTVTVTDWVYSDITLTTDENYVSDYYVGDAQNLNGITVTYIEASTFPGGTRETDVTQSAAFNFNSSSAGRRKTLTATYQDHTTDDVVYYNVSEKPEAAILFGSAEGSLNVNGASVSGNDKYSKEWTVTTAGTTSFTANSGYAQIGSGSSPATSITFSATISNSSVNVVSFSAKFGGFNNTAGVVTLKVGETTVGTGNLNANNDIEVSATKIVSGTTLTVTVTSIARGVKAYYISYKAKTDKDLLDDFVKEFMFMDTQSGDTYDESRCTSNYTAAKTEFKKYPEAAKNTFLTSSDYADAAARLRKWAKANHEVIADEGTFSSSGSFYIRSTDRNEETANVSLIVISGVAAVAASGYFFLRKKKEN